MKLRKSCLLILTLFLVGITSQVPSLAHTSLMSQNPAGNSIVNALPRFVGLTFDETLIAIGDANSVDVKSPTGKKVTTGEVRILNNILIRDLMTSQEFGKFLVQYRVVSADGHVVEGEYTFEVASKVIESVLPTPSSTPSSTSESPNAEIKPSGNPSPKASDKNVPLHTDHGFFDRHDAHIFFGIGALFSIFIWWKIRNRRITSSH